MTNQAAVAAHKPSQQCGGLRAATRPPRRQARAQLLVAHGRRKKTEEQEEGVEAIESSSSDWRGVEVSPALAAQAEDLVQMMPDPANLPESLLDEDYNSLFTGSGSGSEYDWQAPGGADWLIAEDFYGSNGSSSSGGGGGAEGGQQGSAAPAAGGRDFFALQSEDWADSLVSEVGEGSSFRREQRERYAAPMLNMTGLAHATEADLLLGGAQQALLNERTERYEDEALVLHHFYKQNAPNPYAVAVRMGQLIEEVEYDDWALPVEGEEQAIPSWCRANFRLKDEFEELNARAVEDDALHSAEEERFFEERMKERLDKQLHTLDMLSRGTVLAAKVQERRDPLEEMLRVQLPGTEDADDDFGTSGGVSSSDLAAEMLSTAAASADKDFMAVLSGDAFSDTEDDDIVDKVEDDEDAEEEEEEEDGAEASQARGRRGNSGSDGGGAPRRGRSAGRAKSVGTVGEDPLLDLVDL